MIALQSYKHMTCWNIKSVDANSSPVRTIEKERGWGVGEGRGAGIQPSIMTFHWPAVSGRLADVWAAQLTISRLTDSLV